MRDNAYCNALGQHRTVVFGRGLAETVRKLFLLALVQPTNQLRSSYSDAQHLEAKPNDTA